MIRQFSSKAQATLGIVAIDALDKEVDEEREVFFLKLIGLL